MKKKVLIILCVILIVVIAICIFLHRKNSCIGCGDNSFMVCANGSNYEYGDKGNDGYISCSEINEDTKTFSCEYQNGTKVEKVTCYTK